MNFYSHTSCEVWLHSKWFSWNNDSLFLLTHLLRGVTRFCPNQRAYYISTHTPLARCDDLQPNKFYKFGDFYSHTSCEVWHKFRFHFFQINKFLLTHLLRGVTAFEMNVSTASEFLLTHLLRGVTRWDLSYRISQLNFYSHTSCEVWQLLFLKQRLFEFISTHTPLARCDIRQAPRNRQ